MINIINVYINYTPSDNVVVDNGNLSAREIIKQVSAQLEADIKQHNLMIYSKDK